MLRKILCAATAALMLSAAACKSGDSTNTQSPTATPTQKPADSATQTPALSSDPVTLRYLAWNVGTEDDNNLQRRMLKAFSDAHKNVTVEIVTVPQNADGTNGNYADYLNTLASQQNLPDVFMQTSVPDHAAKGWALNVSDWALSDPDYKNVIKALQDGGQINGHVYGIPMAVFLQAIIINYDIFDELNVEPLGYTYTLEDLRAAIAATTSGKYRGTDNFALENWGTFVLNDKLGFATFNGSKYNYSSPEFAQIIEIYQDIVAKKQTGNTGLTGETSTWLPEGAGWAWGEGYVALQFEATWNIGGLVNGDRPFKGDMLPLPDEKAVLIPDFIFVGANTKNAEWAYELAKWMSFGKDGQLERVKIIAENPQFSFEGIPLCAGNIKEVDDAFLAMYKDLPNFNKLYASLATNPANAILEPFKTVPGFDASRYAADTGVMGVVGDSEQSLNIGQLIEAIIRGDKQLADYAAEMDRIANQEYQKASEAVKGK